MAIRMHQADEKERVINAEITNGHVDAIKNIIKKYNHIKNEAQALDFIIKSVGYDDKIAEGVTINGVTYTPDTYE